MISPGYYKTDIKGSTTTFSAKIGKVLSRINTIGVVISVIVLTLIGCKYMFGSVEEKARYKETLTPYVIGVLMLAAGSTLVNVLFQLLNS